MGSRLFALLLAALVVAGCDRQKIAELEEGVATEADVRQRFGQPAAVYDEPGGARTFEYPRQPEGRRNYMITIGADGRMSALRQVLTPPNFEKVRPGMSREEVRRILGQPARRQAYELQAQEAWDWRWLDAGRNAGFVVTFDRDGKVVSAAAGPDPADTQTGGR
jgi:outer membrane protein assembly factor BamE (lipoprotein component of BamABCDE complex)